MGLSKRYLENNDKEIRFDYEELAGSLKKNLPEAVFAYILGSASDGIILPYSDMDLAFYLFKKADIEFYSRVYEVCEKVVPNVRIDAGILNNAEVVYRFEALKGRLLFTRDMESWLTFYSVTSREYEYWMYHYEKQRKYRLEARGGD